MWITASLPWESSVGIKVMLVQMFHSTRCWCWLARELSLSGAEHASMRRACGLAVGLSLWDAGKDWWEETAWPKQKSFVSFHWQPSSQSQYPEAKWSTVNLCGFGDSGSLAFCTIPRYPEKHGKRPGQRLRLTGSALWGVQRKAAPFTLT